MLPPFLAPRATPATAGRAELCAHFLTGNSGKSSLAAPLARDRAGWRRAAAGASLAVAMIGENNTVHGRARFCWREFDRLPAALKAVLNYSAFGMGADFIVQQLEEGVAPADLAAELMALDAATAARAALQTYGPRYPARRP